MKQIFLLVIIALCLACSNEQKALTIHTIGDSTMANKSEKARPEEGWGEEIVSHIVDTSKVHHINYAVNGRSTKSFIDEGRWEEAKKNIVQGDYVFIQFGHNDQKSEDSTRYTNAQTTYKANLRTYVRESRALGAKPVLFTSIVRRNFNEHGVLIDTHGNYAEAVRQVATELNVPLVDAQLLSEKLVLSYGPEPSKQLYNHVAEGHPNYPLGKADDTHLNHNGAVAIANLIVAELKQIDPILAEILN